MCVAKKIYNTTEPGKNIDDSEHKKIWLHIDGVAIAGRNMTFSLSHFYKVLTRLKGYHGRISSLNGKVDTNNFQLSEAE